MKYRIKKRNTVSGYIYWAEVKASWAHAWQSFGQRATSKQAKADIEAHQRRAPQGDVVVWESWRDGGIL